MDFTGDVSEDALQNWGKRLTGVKTKLSIWSTRRLTVSGKVMVLRADILPGLIYLSYIYQLPVRLRRELVRAVFRFLWGGYEYVRREIWRWGREGGAAFSYKVRCFVL